MAIVDYNHDETITTDTNSDEIQVRGAVWVAAELTSGNGTLTWKYKHRNGTYYSLRGGSEGTTEQAFTSSHMVNFYFPETTTIRATASSGTTPNWEIQVVSSPYGRF